MITIRKASIEDHSVIYSMAEKTWFATYLSILSREQLDYMLYMMYSHASFEDQIKIKGHYFLLAMDGDRPVGFASYELNYQKRATKLHKLYVLPETQGKGVGAKLLGVIENEAREKGDERVVLNVNRKNKAVDFYQKIGYEKAGEEDIDIGNGYLMEDFIMQKKV